MKKTLLFTCLAASLLTRSALATISLAATPSSSTVSAGGTFDVSFTLSVTQNTAPANVAGYDLYLATASGNSGRFAVTAATPTGSFNAFGPTIPNGGDPLSTAAASGFVRNGVDLGYSGSPQATPLSNFALVRLTLSVAAGTPSGTYSFSSTTTANAGNFFSDIADSNGNATRVYQFDTPGTFSITVVPEPSTWALFGLGGIGLGILTLRSRRVA